jgi:hypothetical protein
MVIGSTTGGKMLQPFQAHVLYGSERYPSAVQWEGIHDRALDFLRITDRRDLARYSGHFFPDTNTWTLSVHFDNDPYWLGYLVEVSATDVAFFDGPIFTNTLTPEQESDSLSTYQRNYRP